MKTMKINHYNELEKLKGEKQFIIDIKDANANIKIRIIDFISGLTFMNGNLKKIEQDTYEVIIDNN